MTHLFTKPQVPIKVISYDHEIIEVWRDDIYVLLIFIMYRRRRYPGGKSQLTTTLAISFLNMFKERLRTDPLSTNFVIILPLVIQERLVKETSSGSSSWIEFTKLKLVPNMFVCRKQQHYYYLVELNQCGNFFVIKIISIIFKRKIKFEYLKTTKYYKYICPSFYFRIFRKNSIFIVLIIIKC